MKINIVHELSNINWNLVKYMLKFALSVILVLPVT